MDAKQELIQRIQAGSGSYSPYEVFTDWITCLALSIVNACTWEHGWLWEKREQQYKEIMKKHGEKANVFFEMTGLLAMALEDKIEDVLGEVYMRSGCGNKNTGQFFTPFHLSKLSTELGLGNKTPETLVLNEPSCGAGGMIIAAAAVMKDRGISYQDVLEVVAQDLDWKAVYMCYVQLSLLGINATVVQGSTLEELYVQGYPEERIFRTPKKVGILT